MSIQIDVEKCTGCGLCRDVCPGSLLYPDRQGKTFIRYPRDCWGCTACLKECQFGAIRYYLGADIGGKGGYACVRQEKERTHWTIVNGEGTVTVITLDKRQANSY